MQPSSRPSRTRPARGRWLIAGATMAAVVSLSACSAGDASEATGETTGAAPQLVAQLPAATRDVQEVRWNLTKGEPDTLDPRNAATYSGGQVVGNLCEPLVKVNADYQLSPNLADFEQVSPTELRYTLKTAATFWDGSPVTAEDVAYSLNRAAQPDSTVSFIYANVASIQATGDREVTVLFNQPDELFNNEMTTIAGLVMQKAFTEGAGDAVGTPGGGLMCSGPFTLDSWTTGDTIVMSRNDSYWDSSRRPHAAKVTFSFLTDTTAVTQALTSGGLDGAYELPASSLGSLSASTTGTVHYGPSTQSTSLAVARPDGVMDDPELRRALQLIVDREAIAKAIYRGSATPLYSVITPTTWPSDQASTYQAAYDELEEQRGLDLEEAERLVEESGYDGSPIVLAVTAGDETQGRVAQIVQQQGKQVGLNIIIDPLQPLVMSQAGYDADKRTGMDLYFSESFNGVQDPLELTGFTYLPGAAYNYTDFSDPTVTQKLETARQTFDGAERADLFLEAQDVYEQANASIPLVSPNTVTYLSNDLTGAVTSFAYWAMPQMVYVGGIDG